MSAAVPEPSLKLRLEQERTARREAEDARDRLAYLASAGTALTAVLDPKGSAGTLARLIVPAMCDWCTVHTVDDRGQITEAAMAHAAEDGIALMGASRAVLDAAGRPPAWGVADVITTGGPRRYEPVDPAALAAEAVDAPHLELLRPLASGSIAVIPLVARGRVIGALTVARTGSPGRFGSADLSLIENVAGRAAIAFENARLFAERTMVARILQQALLPPSLPEIPGMQVSARYRTGESNLDVGGDFYDVFMQPDGSWSFVVGDVTGKGSVAAAITGLVRHTVRAVSEVGSPPSEVLRRTNHAMMGQVDDSRFCTAALFHVRVSPGLVSVRLASGGHPPPFLLRLDGEVRPLECMGTMLGVVPDPDFDDLDVAMGPGDVIVLYTDGVTEARRGDEEFGEDGIAEVLRTCVGRSAGTIADRLARAVHTFADDPAAADDTAVLVLRVAPAT